MMCWWGSHWKKWPRDSRDAFYACPSLCSENTMQFCLMRVSDCTKGPALLQLYCKDRGLIFLPPYEAVSEKSISSQASAIQPLYARSAGNRASTAVEFLWMDARGRNNSYMCLTQGKTRRSHSLQRTIKTKCFFFNRKEIILIKNNLSCDTMKGQYWLGDEYLNHWIVILMGTC